MVELLVAGCVSRRPASIAGTFIRQGTPTVDLGGPPAPTTAEYVGRLRALATNARPRAKMLTPESAELRDERLRDALAILATVPSASTHYAVAVEYRRAGIPDAAFAHVSTAIKLDRKYAPAYDLRARLWRAWGLPGLGLQDARQAVALAPTSATAWNTLGLILEGGGDTPRAIRAYLRAVQFDTRAGYAWNNLCRSWTAVGEAAAAVNACRRTIDLEPTLVEAQATLVEAERQLPHQRGVVRPTPTPVELASIGTASLDAADMDAGAARGPGPR